MEADLNQEQINKIAKERLENSPLKLFQEKPKYIMENPKEDKELEF